MALAWEAQSTEFRVLDRPGRVNRAHAPFMPYPTAEARLAPRHSLISLSRPPQTAPSVVSPPYPHFPRIIPFLSSLRIHRYYHSHLQRRVSVAITGARCTTIRGMKQMRGPLKKTLHPDPLLQHAGKVHVVRMRSAAAHRRNRTTPLRPSQSMTGRSFRLQGSSHLRLMIGVSQSLR